jgi:hypothetical protein
VVRKQPSGVTTRRDSVCNRRDERTDHRDTEVDTLQFVEPITEALQLDFGVGQRLRARPGFRHSECSPCGPTRLGPKGEPIQSP